MSWVGRWKHVGSVRGRSDFAGIRERKRLYEVIHLLDLSGSGVTGMGW
jgi:hypothetical protein